MARSSKDWILFFFCAASVLVSFNVSALTAVIPAISRSLNVSTNDAASIIPFYMIPYGLCALVYAPLATRFSIKWLMVLSCALFAIGNALSLWQDQLSIILLGRVVAGFGAAAVTPLALMTLGKIFEKQVRGRVLGAFFSSSFLGAVLGLSVSACMTWHWLFILPLVLSIVLAIAFNFCPSEGMEANTEVKINYIDALTTGGLRRILMYIFLMSLLFHGVCKWYGVFLDRVYGYNQMTISLLIILSTLVASFGQVIGGYISDTYGRKQACTVGVVILGMFIMSLYGHYPLWGIATVLCVISIGWTIAHNGISTLLTDFSQNYRCELAALNSSVRFFSGGLGFWLSGSFMENNFGATFLGIGILMLSLLAFIPHLSASATD